ncbi:MAG: glyoxalase [Pseudohongiella nitratireducens]|nr:glyoxalase [Pseudohongiella nitratireducens]MDF1624340.1 glyoxalase [Pseudohongiella nitratireducens]
MDVLAIDHVQLVMPQGEEDKARIFYEGILGIPETPKPAKLAKRGGVWFENKYVKIHLGVEDNFLPARKAHPALVVSGLEHLITKLEKEGYVVSEDHNIPGVIRAFSYDPFGNRIEFIQSSNGER